MNVSHLEEERATPTRTGYDLYYIGKGYMLTFDLESLFLKRDKIEDGEKIELSAKETQILSTLNEFLDLRNHSERGRFAAAVGYLIDIITE